MCLTVINSFHKVSLLDWLFGRSKRKALVAKENLLVWKVVKVEYNNGKEFRYRSPYQRQFTWKANVNQVVEGFTADSPSRIFRSLSLVYGLHAIINESRAKFCALNSGIYSEETFSAQPCIIPKGALYWRGTKDEVMASQMTLLRGYEVLERRVGNSSIRIRPMGQPSSDGIIVTLLESNVTNQF